MQCVSTSTWHFLNVSCLSVSLVVQMHGIAGKLQQLLAENAHAEPIDQLDRMEFCVDVTGKTLLEEEFRQKAKALEASISLVCRATHPCFWHWRDVFDCVCDWA